MASEKRCGDCRWFEPDVGMDVRDEPYGACRHPATLGVLPSALYNMTMSEEFDGWCKTFERKETTK